MRTRPTLPAALGGALTLGALALGALPLGTLPAAAAPANPSGTWLTADSRARIRVEKCGVGGEQVCGYVVWLDSPLDNGQPRVDTRNPDPKKRGRPILGHQMLMGLTPGADDRYVGQVYNNEDGKSYDVTVWMEKGDLKVKGCLVAFLCSTQTWARKGDVAPGQLAGPTGGQNGPFPEPQWASKSPDPAGPATASKKRS